MMDWRGVPIAIYGELGKEIWRGEFGPFGEPLYERGVVSNYIPFRLYGMYKDMETGLYYNVRRYYDWRVGRYLQPDPVSDLNLYVYVNNSPYDLVDPVGMFETAIRIRAEVDLGPITYVYRHSGAPKHEEITEEAINSLRYPKLSQYGFRIDDWEGGLQFQVGSKVNLRCRREADSVAQGTNIADCLFKDSSSYHCDNSDFDGCFEKFEMIIYPETKGNIVECRCESRGGSGGSCGGWGSGVGGGNGGNGGGWTDAGGWNCRWTNYGGRLVYECAKSGGSGGGGGGGGCSVIGTRQVVGEERYCKCSCFFKNSWNYMRLGYLIHAVQDFWSHSNAIFVPGCQKTEWAWVTKGTALVYRKVCVEYKVERKFDWNLIASSSEANQNGLFTGLYGGGGWGEIDDTACAIPYVLQSLVDLPSPKRPPCDIGRKIMAHCMLNKDGDWGGDRACMDACDQGYWNGDCGGSDTIQRYAHKEVKDKAYVATKWSLWSFCAWEAPHLCR